jgi:hypothetical protein
MKEFNLWNERKTPPVVILSGGLVKLMNASLHLLNNGLLEFNKFEIRHHNETDLPWEDGSDIVYRIVSEK